MDKTEKINSLNSYVHSVIQRCEEWKALESTTHPWFRGQANVNWGLLPRLYRDQEDSMGERELIRDFKLRAPAFLPSNPENDLELLFIMQHHMMPTRLLDWTESHLIALFFAVAAVEQDTDATVWILRPASLNDKASHGPGPRVPMSNASIYEGFIFDVDAYPRIRKVPASEPLAVRPRHSTPRIVAQRGMFTIHGHKKIGIEEHAKREETKIPIVDKIIIDRTKKKRLKKELLLAGISYSTLFPDLEGLCLEIQYRYSRAYLDQKME